MRYVRSRSYAYADCVHDAVYPSVSQRIEIWRIGFSERRSAVYRPVRASVQYDEQYLTIDCRPVRHENPINHRDRHINFNAVRKMRNSRNSTDDNTFSRDFS